MGWSITPNQRRDYVYEAMGSIAKPSIFTVIRLYSIVMLVGDVIKYS